MIRTQCKVTTCIIPQIRFDRNVHTLPIYGHQLILSQTQHTRPHAATKPVTQKRIYQLQDRQPLLTHNLVFNEEGTHHSPHQHFHFAPAHRKSKPPFPLIHITHTLFPHILFTACIIVNGDERFRGQIHTQTKESKLHCITHITHLATTRVKTTCQTIVLKTKENFIP